MFVHGKKPQNLLGQPAALRQPSRRLGSFGRSLGVLGLFLLLLILACGIFILVTNGLYLWDRQPGKLAFDQVSSRLQEGLPATARTEAERQTFYSECAASLEGLAGRLANLNGQPWTLAVLFKDELRPDQVQAAQDMISRGRKAVAAYYQAAGSISRDAAVFMIQTGEPGPMAGLAEQLAWYARRISQVDALEAAYAALGQLPDLDLAGSPLNRDELGLTGPAAMVQEYRQPVQALQALLASSNRLENRLDALYEKNPLKTGLADAEASWANMQLDQNALLSQAAALSGNLPAALQASFRRWQDGLTRRGPFIQVLQNWWQNAVQVETSIASAAVDRATAKRDMADSLKEANVETAYLWTRTAEEYRLRMNTAIDFANIAVEKTNLQIRQLPVSREEYRTGLGLAPAVRPVPELERIQPEAFWLAE
jgi:hypothetical protein